MNSTSLNNPGPLSSMSRNAHLIIFMILLIILGSCRTARKTIKEPIKEYGAEFLFEKLKENELRFDWFSGKFSLDLVIDKKKSSFNGQVRIRKDSAIWVSFSPLFGIEMARLLISNDSVKYINRINNTYFTGTFETANRFLDSNIDFDVIQSLLMGNDLTYYDDGRFRASYDSREYHLVTAGRRKLRQYVKNNDDEKRIYIQNIFLSPETFKITNMKIKEVEKENTRLEATYSDFQEVSRQLFPHTINFEITAGIPVLVTLNYSRIILNDPKKLSFNIPKKYSRLE